MLNLKSYGMISSTLQPLIAGGFLLRSLTQKAYRDRMSERFGRYRGDLEAGGIVVHGSSVGEIIALQPLVKNIMENHPDKRLTVTTFTPTGSDQVQRRFGSSVQHCYLPVDAKGPVERFLSIIQPEILIIMETEIWPVLIDRCHKRNIKILLINARISGRSFPKYQKIIKLIKPTLQKLNAILAQSQDDQDRLIALGAKTKKTCVSGNIKYDIPAKEPLSNSDAKVSSGSRKIWVVGSSHEDEEDLILDAYNLLLGDFRKLMLVIAPRHPERIEPLSEKIVDRRLTFIKRSELDQPSEGTHIWLIDTMGELLTFYALGDVCTIAGSFGKTGGHNPLEAALFAKPIIVGTNMDNFKDIHEQLLASKAVLQIKEDSAIQLAEAVKHLLQDKPLAETLGKNAESVLLKNRGALQKTLDALDALLG